MDIKCWQPEEIVENKYKIKQVLGQGMLGISYEVEHFDWEMHLRLKVFSPECWQSNCSAIKYVNDHWIAMEGFPQIANAYYWDFLQNQNCLLSEYIQGIPLETYHTSISNLASGIHLAIQIAYALQDSHSSRLVHRNLKPSNIIIREQNGAEQKVFVFLQDFIGLHFSHDSLQPKHTANGILSKIFGCEDFIQYGKLLYYIFYQTKWDIHTIIHHDSWLSMRGWELPKELENIIKLCLEPNDKISWDTIILHLKSVYESLGLGLYKKSNIVSSRIQVEKIHKQAIAYIESKNFAMAHNLWNIAGENHPPSINALWNNYLCNLREGITSMDLLVRTMEELTAFEHNQIICAQGELALEMGLHIQDTIERIENNKEITPTLQRIKGELYYRVCQFEDAIHSFEQLLSEYNPNVPISEKNDKDDYYRLAIAHYGKGNFAQARDVCRKGLLHHPNHHLLHLVEASMSYLLDDHEVFQEKLKFLQKNYIGSFWVLVHLADWYAGRGLYHRSIPSEQIPIAQELYQKALAVCPNSTRAIQGFKFCGGITIPIQNSYCIQPNEWSQIRTLSGHNSIITSLAMNPSAEWIVSGDCDGNLYLWAGNTGTLTTGFIGHSKHITSLAISEDGKTIASASWDHTIRIWEAQTGACLWEVQGHHESITKISFSRDTQYLISGSWDGTAKIWDIPNRKLHTTLQHPGVWVKDVAIFPNNELAVTNTEQDEVCVWDIQTSEMLQRIRGISFCLAHDGQYIVVSYYNSIELWEMPSTQLLDYIKVNSKEICVSITQDNAIVLTKNENDFISFWDLAYKRKLNILQSDEATCAMMNYTGQYMVTSYNTNIYLWENITQRSFPLFRHTHFLPTLLHDTLKTPEMIEQNYRQAEIAYQANKYQESFNLSYSLLKIPGYESSELLLQQTHKSALRQPVLRKEVQNITLRSQVNMIGYATSSALANEGRIVLIGNDDDPIRQWNLKGNYVSHRWEGHNRCVSSISMTNDTRLALSASYDGSAIVWYVDYPKEYKVLEVGNTWINTSAIHPTGRWGLIGTRDGRVIQWDLENFKDTLLYSPTEDNPVVGSSIQDNIGFTSLRDGTMLVWDMLESKLLAKHRPHGRYITGFDVSHQGKFVLSSSRNGSILFWESESGKVLKEFKHEGEVIKYIKFSYDKFFISLAKDGGLRIWHLESPEPLSYYYAHDNPVTTASISDDGRFLVSADEAKILKLWELEWDWKNLFQ